RVAEVVVELARLSLWHPIPPDRVKNRFAAAVENRPDAEIAKTFYNSAIRRLFGTQGVDHQNEFLDLSAPRLDETGVRNRLVGGNESEVELVVGNAMKIVGPKARWEDRLRDVARIAERLLHMVPDAATGLELVILPEPLIRNRRAFLVGRLTTERRSLPF